MAEIQGSAASETLVGTSGNDAIDGGAGDDLLRAGAGNDGLDGGEDSDSLFGGMGDDALAGGDGDDILCGEGGDDALDGGAGNDQLFGGAGDDLVHGGEGNDYIHSDENGSDALFGDDGDDQIYLIRVALPSLGPTSSSISGGAGNDYLFVQTRESHNVSIDAGEGDDRLFFAELYTSANVTLGAGRDIVDLGMFDFYASRGGRLVIADFEAGPGGDYIWLDSLLSSYTSWNGSLNPFASGHLKIEQVGADAVLSSRSSPATNGAWLQLITFTNVSAATLSAHNLGGYSPDGNSGPVVTTGTDAAEVLTGGGGDDIIQGLAGFNKIFAGAGNDSATGGEDVDWLYGGTGNDFLTADAGNDFLSGGDGNDILFAGAGNDSLNAGPTGADQLYGEEGDDTLSLSRSAAVAATALGASGGDGNDGFTIDLRNAATISVDGGAGSDIVTVNNLNGLATLALGAGQDRLVLAGYSSPTGNGRIVVGDFETGPAGDRIELHTYFNSNLTGWDKITNPFLTGFARLLQSGPDTVLQVDRNGGGDSWVTLVTLEGVAATDLTEFNLGGYSPDGTSSASLDLDGGAEADTLFGNEAGDLIEGHGGGDRIWGLGGNDMIFGGESDDILDGGTGDDEIDGGLGNDQLAGGTGNDVLAGGADDDTLIETGSGSDSLSGGDGADFINVSRSSGTDQIVANGDGGNDLIRISANATTGITVDAGAGDDEVELRGIGTATITLGAGHDTIDLNLFAPAAGAAVSITDFEAGDGGDTIDLDDRLASAFYVTDPSANPFATGFLRLVKSGADTILQYDEDGAGTARSFVNWLTLSNVDIFSLTADNFDGFQTNVTTGTAAGEVLVGTSASDYMKGFGGEDDFHLGYGGADRAIGGAQDDVFIVHLVTAGTLEHKVEGGDGNDLLVLEGNRSPYSRISIGGTTGDRIEATGIEGLVFLSFIDQQYSPGPFDPRNYYVTLEDNVAAAGTQFTVDARPLSNLEKLDFTTTDTDAFLLMFGGSGDDSLRAGGGGSRIYGNGGADLLKGGRGDDELIGGAGNDRFEEYSGAVTLDTISGGAGSDYIEVYRTSITNWGTLQANGDADNDTFEIDIRTAGTAIFDGGEGSDRFKIEGGLAGTTRFTLGAGADFFDIYVPGLIAGQGAIVTDYNPAEDTIGIILSPYLPGYNGTTNPFGTGHLRVVADGADVLFQADRLLDGSWVTLLRLENLTLAEMQSASIGGWSISPVNGTEGADDLTGTIHGDMIFAGGGNDLLRIQQGGVDKAMGGTGDDVFVLGSHLNDKEEIDGGEGSDTVLLQGFVNTTLGAKSLLGIETLRMLSGSDTSFGAPGTSTYTYRVTTADANVAAGATLFVDMTQLRAGENVTFNGAAEFDGRFVMNGGAGGDTFTGGAGADQIAGGLGDDNLSGGSGSDQVDGGDGNDILAGGSGSDAVSGGDGDDVINETGSGSDIVSGNDGNDQINLTRSSFSTDVVSALGGAGADRFTVTMTGSALTIDAGEGDDVVTLKSNYNVKVTLGGGADTIDLSQFVRTAGIPEILDFQTGAGGDTISWGSLNFSLWNWTGSQGDPFRTGYARLAQVGADVHLQVNNLGNGGLSSPYATALIFKNVDKSAFTAANLGGYSPLGLTGTDAGETLTGTRGDDVIAGAGGNDLFLVHQGGTDALSGGEGDDSFFFGTRFPQSWQASGITGPMIDGGAGADTILIQNLGLNRWPVPTSGIEAVRLLSGTDNSYGTGGAKIASSSITFLDADITGMPLFTIDASGLLTGEKVTIDLRQESDVELILIGGAGDDHFTPGSFRSTIYGGAGNDTFEGIYGGDNSFFGGAGNDISHGWGDNVVDGGEGDDVLEEADLGTDRISGGAGNDVIRLRGNSTEKLNDVTASGGDGDDRIELDTYYPGIVAIDGGAGADTISITGAKGTITIALGAGQDVFTLHNMTWVLRPATTLTITDFAAGNGGDRFDWAPILASGLSNYQAGSNPFLTGHARIVQSGADTFLQVDRDGSSPGYGFVTYVTLAGVDAASLTAFNLGFAAQYAGSPGDDAMTGTSGPDWMEGGAGDDSLDGGAGSDRMFGGSGNDLYMVDNSNDVVFEAGGEGTDEVRTGLATYVLAANVEKLTATTAGNHDFRGNASDNFILTLGGNDFVRIQDGGNDSASTGAGTDTIYVGGAFNAFDFIDGGSGVDTIAMQGDYSAGLTFGTGLTSNIAGIEGISLVAGSSTSFGDTADNRYDYVFTMLNSNVAAGVQFRINGGNLLEGEDLTVDGSAETDGSFLIYGGKGADVLTGGANSDIFFFAHDGRLGAGDHIDGGAGYDGLFIRGNFTVDFNDPAYFELVRNVENFTLTSVTDTRYARSSDTEFDYDLITDDGLVAAGTTVTFNGGQLQANETMVFDASHETDGHLRIFAGASNDSLTGGAGNDLIYGGLGADRLDGGGGSDVFRYNAAAESTGTGHDTIIGFDYSVDRIDLAGTHDSYGTKHGGALDAATFDADLAAAMSGVLTAGKAIFFDSDSGDQAGKTFLVVDQNGVAGYQAGQDFVFDVTASPSPVGPIPDFLI
ncbi:MAG TPA: type I secretion C-terminal target domain-containing protein [Allosphingosinicella sp.]